VNKSSELLWQDFQHRQLFALIDDIKTARIGSEVFDRLNQYADTHFLLEEEYMESLGYPKITQHIKAHNKFRVELSLLAKDKHNMTRNEFPMLAQFLEEWLTRHIFGVDKELEDYILKSDQK